MLHSRESAAACRDVKSRAVYQHKPEGQALMQLPRDSWHSSCIVESCLLSAVTLRMVQHMQTLLAACSGIETGAAYQDRLEDVMICSHVLVLLSAKRYTVHLPKVGFHSCITDSYLLPAVTVKVAQHSKTDSKARSFAPSGTAPEQQHQLKFVSRTCRCVTASSGCAVAV